MNSQEWEDLKEQINEEFCEDLLNTIQCGAFDGGCVIVAQALQSVIGGELYVLVNASDLAGHAVVMVDGRLWDYDGPMEPDSFVKRFIFLESLSEKTWFPVGYRPMRADDLELAFRDEELQKRIEERFRKILGDALKAEPALPTSTPTAGSR